MANPISPKMKIGTIGELLVQLRLLQYDVQAAPPLKDSGNDLIALKGFVIRCIQIKTTTNGVPRKPLNRAYHLLAIVKLKGEDYELKLDRSDIYMLSRDEIGGVKWSWEGLHKFKLDVQRVKDLFQVLSAVSNDSSGC